MILHRLVFYITSPVASSLSQFKLTDFLKFNRTKVLNRIQFR